MNHKLFISLNKDARDLMLDAPSKVYEKQLKELGLKNS